MYGNMARGEEMKVYSCKYHSKADCNKLKRYYKP